MSDTPSRASTTGLKSSSAVILKIGTTGGVITAHVSFACASRVIDAYLKVLNSPDPPGIEFMSELALDEHTGEVVPVPAAVWDWSETTAVWIEPYPPDDERTPLLAAEIKRSNDLRERELELRERESRQPWEGDE